MESGAGRAEEMKDVVSSGFLLREREREREGMGGKGGRRRDSGGGGIFNLYV